MKARSQNVSFLLVGVVSLQTSDGLTASPPRASFLPADLLPTQPVYALDYCGEPSGYFWFIIRTNKKQTVVFAKHYIFHRVSSLCWCFVIRRTLKFCGQNVEWWYWMRDTFPGAEPFFSQNCCPCPSIADPPLCVAWISFVSVVTDACSVNMTSYEWKSQFLILVGLKEWELIKLKETHFCRKDADLIQPTHPAARFLGKKVKAGAASTVGWTPVTAEILYCHLCDWAANTAEQHVYLYALPFDVSVWSDSHWWDQPCSQCVKPALCMKGLW